MENPAEVPNPRDAGASSDDAFSDSTQRAGFGLPDWRDLEGVAMWLVRYLNPAEAKTVAQAVLDRVGLIEQTPGM